MMKKRVISAMLAIVLTLSLSVSAFATTYSDLNGHWAKASMEDLATKGYLTGYSDGTMKPDKNMSTGETLAFLSRLYALTDVQAEMIRTDYEATVKEVVPTTYDWAYKSLEICLAAGILTKDELKSLNLSADILREKISVYLVRALQLTAAANGLGISSLSFTDNSKITADCVGSVAELVSLGILKGDSSNTFLPKSAVSRAVAATLLSRSLTYLSVNKTTLTIAAYDGTTREEGIITSLSKSNIEVCGYNGLTKNYAVSSGATTTVNKIAKTIDATYVGAYTLITVKNGVVIGISIDFDTTTKWIQGTVTTVSGPSSTNMLYLKDLKTGTSTNYVIPSTTAITRDGKTVLFPTILAGDFITMKIVNGAITELRAAPNSTQLSGTISSITYGSTVSFKITDSGNVTYPFTFDIASLPTIKRGDKIVSIDRLQSGNKVTLLLEKGKVTSITAEGTANTVTGVLTSLTMTTSSTVWVITATNGIQATYTLDNGAGVYSGTTSILLSDIHPGDSVSVVVYDNTITEISLLSSSSSSTRVTGTVLKVDAANSLITILTSTEKLITVKTASVVSIIVASTGNYTNVSAVAVNSKLTAYGSYSDSKTFAAKSIIIE